MIRNPVGGAALVAAAMMMPAGAQPASAQTAEMNAYANSIYGYCDAKKIAAVWGRDIGSAKAVIGAKILNNLQHLADQDIASTRNQVRCGWDEAELSYNDAVRLGQYWGRQPHEAKLKVEQMMTEMGHKQFRIAMASVLGR